MRKRSMFVGMDVHQHSIDLTVAESGHHGAVTHFASIGGDLAALDGAIATLRTRDAELHFVYEAGRVGTRSTATCTRLGSTPRSWPRRRCRRKRPTGSRPTGATRAPLAIQHRAGALRPIYVPDEDDEAIRDLGGTDRAHHCPRRGGRGTTGESSMALRAVDPAIPMLAPSGRQPRDGIETGGNQPADISRVQSSVATRPSQRGRESDRWRNRIPR